MPLQPRRRVVGASQPLDVTEMQGGGIWNGVFLSGPPVELSADHSQITANSLSTNAGGSSEGGGIFTTEPVTLNHTAVTGNHPDQCVGC